MSTPKPIMLSLSMAFLLMSLCLLALRAPSVYADASPHPLTQPQFPTMILTKTVGTDPTACAATRAIRVVPGAPVYACLTLTNSSSVSLTVHTLRDTRIGDAAFIVPLAVGQTAVMTQLQPVLGQFVFTPTASMVSYPFTATVSTNTTGTVLYQTEQGNSIAVTATARVNVIDPQVVQTLYLPLIYTLPPPTFSATMDVTVSKSELEICETTDVRVSIDVSEGCQYPILELKLILDDADQSMFTFLSPETALVGNGVSNPFTYTLRAEESGAAVFAVEAYGERYCGDFWNWRYVRGTSPTVTVR